MKLSFLQIEQSLVSLNQDNKIDKDILHALIEQNIITQDEGNWKLSGACYEAVNEHASNGSESAKHLIQTANNLTFDRKNEFKRIEDTLKRLNNNEEVYTNLTEGENAPIVQTREGNWNLSYEKQNTCVGQKEGKSLIATAMAPLEPLTPPR
jgi:hypothetical protein